MAGLGVPKVLEECVRRLNNNTAQPEDLLSLQDGLAADFTSLTKTLYDLHKAEEPTQYKGSPLVQLLVDEFDEEQIWQELELQNCAMLKHFRGSIDEALSDETLTVLEEEKEEEEGQDDGGLSDEDPEESEPKPVKKKAPKGVKRAENDSEEDSDLDFDVDALEKKEKQKKPTGQKGSKMKVIPSEVDDKFFKLSEMESFLDDMDKQEGQKDDDEDGVDYFQDLPSDYDDDLDLEQMTSSKKSASRSAKSSRNLKYTDFFDAVDGEPAKTNEQSEEEDGSPEEDAEEEEEDDDDDYGDQEDDVDENIHSKVSRKKVTFNLSEEEEEEEDTEGEDMEDIFGGKAASSDKSVTKSSFEKRQEKMSEKIKEMENAALADKPWQLSGEVTAQTRPENSMLEEDVEFEQASRMAPTMTEETTLQLEDIIKQRIKDQAFDDVVRKEKPKEEVFEYKKRLSLDHEKSKQSLAEIYEQEYLKQSQQKTEEQENPAHGEIEKLMDSLFLKLDALSNFHFTPKPRVPEVKVVSNLPSITMEEVAPVSTSDATLLAPEEIKEKNKAGEILGEAEKTPTDRNRERRKKKTLKRLKIKEKEKRQKLKEAAKTGENKKQSKAEITENLKKLTKGGKATILKDDGKDKALRSSQAFFSQLQDQVKSQIKSAKDSTSKKKKSKEFSASKLKL
ncbi:U3 small nucleolar ribonucleoprotein MPP10 [Gouania willdenowi]|nr:U3 small nucleolar ribonucleoprotein protein MPP10 [Gouania willdenowi]